MTKGFASRKPDKKAQSQVSPQPLTIPELKTNLSTCFDDIPDPRAERTKLHLLKDILVIALLSTISGGNGWEDMENYGISKLTWLKEFLKLPNGIPSDDTFRRVFERLNPQGFEKILTDFIHHILGLGSPRTIPIDGKTLRGSYDREKGLKNLHLVTA
ncbi:ISAs1 family transposase [Phormidium sp. CCY1219]|uniref:ISAs1 family transposase n=1 Tax=Phormidium sp. CCY1219 TaxID=2886104 RepID=UPI002D1F8412|nr:ISAs1 family transposase [Phormidium sp. CCY1219]MEB3828502.1 ISAs1 family transposase [Phormidium sp. CCY1219]